MLLTDRVFNNLSREPVEGMSLDKLLKMRTERGLQNESNCYSK